MINKFPYLIVLISIECLLRIQGHDNYAFEMEAPKSPWRYPHLNFRDSKRNRRGRFGPNHRQPDTRVQVQFHGTM